MNNNWQERKLQAEVLKLERQNKRKWFLLRPEWWAALLPGVLGIITLIYIFHTGIIDMQATKNANEAILNKIDADSLQRRKDHLSRENDGLNRMNIRLSVENQDLSTITQKLKADSVFYSGFYQNLVSHVKKQFSTESEKVNYLANQLFQCSDNKYSSPCNCAVISKDSLEVLKMNYETRIQLLSANELTFQYDMQMAHEESERAIAIVKKDLENYKRAHP